jgi:hypothetical protein
MQSRSRAFWSGARRGAKFGATAGIVIWLIIAIICLVLVAFIPKLREEALADIRKQTILSAIGGFIAPILLMAIYGAVPGAIIMGIAAARRAGRGESSEAT